MDDISSFDVYEEMLGWQYGKWPVHFRYKGTKNRKMLNVSMNVLGQNV